MKHTILSIIYCVIVVTGVAADAFGDGFVHPGISHNASELTFLETKLKAREQPWQQAWEQLRTSSFAELSWKPRPVAHVERGAYNKPDIGGTYFLRDGTAAYTHALIWRSTREEAHAVKAAEILDAWSVTLESVSNHDAKLLVGMGGINYCNAAELLKHTWDQWPETDQDAFRNMLRRVLYPVIEDFFPTANGNWDASMIQTMMAMGIHLDDPSIFQKAVDYFLEGEGNGAVNHYFNHFGQCQESGRDQGHTQMGLEYLVNASEIAWKQGVDVYGAYDNRLAQGFEYTARYNLGEDVAFEYYESYRGRYKHHQISDKSRGRLRAMYEKAYNHYHNRMGMDMPWCEKAIEKTRPECGGGSSLPWSTLMYANQPSGLVTLGETNGKPTGASGGIRNYTLSPVAIEPEVTSLMASKWNDDFKHVSYPKQSLDKVFTVVPGDSIQSAIDAAYSAGGGVVVLKEGIHSLDRGITLRSNVTITGEGRERTVLLQGADMSGSAFNAEPEPQVTDVVIKDLALKGTQGSKANGIKMAGKNESRHTRIMLQNITVSHWSAHGVHIKRADHIIMDHCIVQLNGSAGGLYHNVYFLYNKYILQSDCDMSFPVKGKGNKYTSTEYVLAQRCTIMDCKGNGIQSDHEEAGYIFLHKYNISGCGRVALWFPCEHYYDKYTYTENPRYAPQQVILNRCAIVDNTWGAMWRVVNEAYVINCTFANKKIDMGLLKCSVTIENSTFTAGNQLYADVGEWPSDVKLLW